MLNKEEKIKEIILEIIDENNLNKIDALVIKNDSLLTDDLGLDSLNLAQLTVKIEAELGIDIFEKKIIRTFGEIMETLD
jgi:acyl carrier protein